jgi:acetyl-CoA C-acetyltransferase
VDYRGLEYPGAHSSRSGRYAARQAYGMAGIEDPLRELDVAEVDDSTTFGELLAYEQLGLCRLGEGGRLIVEGSTRLNGIIPVNPSGGLLGMGTAPGANGIIQALMALWQLQSSTGRHFRGDTTLQVEGARTAVVHTSTPGGALATVTVLRRED